MTLGDKARNTLLKCGEIVAASYGYELATVGQYADGDHRFFARMRAGKNLGFKKYDEVACFLRGHWPQGAVWPKKDAIEPPEDAQVRKFMAKLPKKRRLTIPKSWRNKFLESPSVDAAETLAPVRSKPATPSAKHRTGEFVDE